MSRCTRCAMHATPRASWSNRTRDRVTRLSKPRGPGLAHAPPRSAPPRLHRYSITPPLLSPIFTVLSPAPPCRRRPTQTSRTSGAGAGARGAHGAGRGAARRRDAALRPRGAPAQRPPHQPRPHGLLTPSRFLRARLSRPALIRLNLNMKNVVLAGRGGAQGMLYWPGGPRTQMP